MSNETIKDQVRRLIAGIAPCYEKRPDLIKDDDYCFGFMVQVVELAIAEEREASGWVSVEDRLPVCEFENTELGVMVSQTVNIYGVSVDDNHGEGFGELHSDGRWVCYGGEHDFMNVKEVTHWSPLRAAPKAEVSK